MEIFAYRVNVFPGPPIDLTDFDVESDDGEHIGKIDEATYESGSGALIVDTGHWIFGKRRMLPAGVITRLDPEAKKVFLSMTKDQVKHAPDYDHEQHAEDESAYHEHISNYYEPYGVHGAGTESLHEAEAVNFTEPGAERFL